VELKEFKHKSTFLVISLVSNLPCGVERRTIQLKKFRRILVSNLPCGVERGFSSKPLCRLRRVSNLPCGVESKAVKHYVGKKDVVSNLPCGVERGTLELSKAPWKAFLIYRVELKEN